MRYLRDTLSLADEFIEFNDNFDEEDRRIYRNAERFYH